MSVISVVSPWSGPSGAYDFLSVENATKWSGWLQPGLRKIQKQVQPRLEINDDALAYLERMVFRLLAQMCASQPHTLTDVESYVQKNFATPIDTWALSDAKMLMERAQKKKVLFVFPVDKMFPQLQKEVFGYKIELNLVQFIMAILDYVSADILKLAGNFVKNTRRAAVYIQASDINVSMSADPALQALFQPLQGQREPVNAHPPQPSKKRKSLCYDDVLRETVDNEKQYIRHLNLILKVFLEPFLNLFPDQELQQIVINLQELYEISAQLVGSLEECIEMSGEDGEQGAPQAGFIFEEIAESYELEVYIRYAENYMMAKTRLEEMVDHPDVVEHFKTQPISSLREAMKYILPKSLDEPCYHCFHYFDAIESLFQMSPDAEDQDALGSAISVMLGLKSNMESVCSRFLKKRSRDDNGMFFGKRQGYQVVSKQLTMIQQKIEGWEGPDILNCCTEFIMEGALGVMREGRGKPKDKSDRHVFLLDGLIICCKSKSKGGVGLKEKISMRKVKLTDLEDTDELKYAFSLQDQFQPGLIFFAISKIEKNDWMALLTHLVTRSTFDRLLDIKLRDEERSIPPLRPSSSHYRFAEEDSEFNIMFDEKDGSSTLGGQGPLIKAGTIYKLVERLTYHEYADPTFVRTFLMTYRSFSKPSELLELLLFRYQIPNPVESEDMEAKRDPNMMKALKRCKDNYIYPIQLRVLNVLRHWVEFHFYDFEREPKLLDKLKQFVDGVKSKKLQKWVSSIHRSLQKHEDEEKAPVAKPVFDREPEPLEWHIAKPNEINEYSILTLHPVEVARQITLIQYNYFKAIHPSELVDASWMKEQKKEQASPNLLKLNRFETTVSNWLSEDIVFTENAEERVALVSRLVDIMEALLNLNNFAGMFVINAALESASVFRLKHTLKGLHSKRQQTLEDMKKIASSERGFRKYKDKLRNVDPPCVPFLGMYMTWIVFIKDGNEDKIHGMPDNFINFKKRRKIADVLQEIQQFQNTPYCLTPEATIQKYILAQDPLGDSSANHWEEKIFDQSRSIEPKDGPVKTAPRKFKYDLRPPQESKTATLNLLGRRAKQPHATLPHPVSQEPISSQADGADQSPKSESSPSSPSFRHTTPKNGMQSPRKISTSNEPFRPPKLPPKPQSTPVSLSENSSNGRQSTSSLTPSSNSDPPPLPYRLPAIPKRTPLSSSNALPLPPKQSTPNKNNVGSPLSPLPPKQSTPDNNNAGPPLIPLPPKQSTPNNNNAGPPLIPLPPKQSTPDKNIAGPPLPPRVSTAPTLLLNTRADGLAGPPLPPKFEVTPVEPQRDSRPIVPPRDHINHPLRKPTDGTSPPPPVPPRR